MKNILITSFDMEVGGVERSLISMLNNFDYDKYKVDLLLYSHTGDFMNLLPKEVNLLEENRKYKTYRMPIKEVFKNGDLGIGMSRILSKIIAKFYRYKENGYIQMQYMWKYGLHFLPKLNKEYDVAISYLWPHDFVGEKVSAKIKIAWIHTDYSEINTQINIDLNMWDKFDYIVSISEDVTNAFISKYPSLKNKIILVENITSPKFVKDMSNKKQNEVINVKGQFNIVSVGRLCYQKGFDNAIKALKLLHNQGLSNIKWYVVGYGGDEELLRKLIKENELEESFILLGKKTNPYPYMKACDLYVQPSRYEGKAVTVSEAKILNKAIIITKYATANSQVKNMFDGYICESSVEGIAEGIKYLYENPKLRKLLSENCRNSDYSNTNELVKLYEIINKN